MNLVIQKETHSLLDVCVHPRQKSNMVLIRNSIEQNPQQHAESESERVNNIQKQSNVSVFL